MKVFKLENYLSIAPPESLDVTFQILPEYSDKQPVLCVWKNYSLRYFVACQPVAGNQSHDLFWANKETELKLSTSDKKVRILKAGMYQTDVKRNVSFRIYQINKSGELAFQIFHLISSKHKAYLLSINIFDGAEVSPISDEVIQIIKTARITAPQRHTVASA